VLEYKEGFDPNYEEQFENESEASENEQENVVDGFEIVGKSKEAKKNPPQKV